jgi:sterol desaturase/sphingolipid hydroxylase (fatty acid hydroxylase superfamily)
MSRKANRVSEVDLRGAKADSGFRAALAHSQGCDAMEANPLLVPIELDRLLDLSALLYPVYLMLRLLFATDRINLYWAVVMIACFLLANYLLYSHFRATDQYGARQRPFWKFSFPREIFAHRSTRADLLMLFINTGIRRLPLVSLIITPFIFGAMIARWLTGALGASPGADFFARHAQATIACYLIVLVFLRDLTEYTLHAMSHKIPALWELHKVHHSAAVLSVFTSFREHPLRVIYDGLAVAVVTSVYFGVLKYLAPGVISLKVMISGSLLSYIIARLVFLFGHYWRPVSFGALDRVFITPAMHIVHHSLDPRHHDRNFGNAFAIWDWMFGTLHLASKEELENIQVGVTGHKGEAKNPGKEPLLIHVLRDHYVRPLLAMLPSARARLGN